MRQSMILRLIENFNKKHGVDLCLVGSWATKGFSDNDIDLSTDLICEERLIPACLELAQETGLPVDLFVNQIKEFNLYCIRPNGDHYWWIDKELDKLQEAGSK